MFWSCTRGIQDELLELLCHQSLRSSSVIRRITSAYKWEGCSLLLFILFFHSVSPSLKSERERVVSGNKGRYLLRCSGISRHRYAHGGWSRNLVWKNIWDIVARYKEQHQLKWHKCYLSLWPDGAACCCPACGPISIDNHIDKFFPPPPILAILALPFVET